MPLTLAHPAAVIPLCRPMMRFGVTSALVIGSVVPDLVYFIPMGIGPRQIHSLLGLFWYCVPTGVVAYALFHLLLAPVAAHVLPEAIVSRFDPGCMSAAMPNVSKIGVLLSVAAGAATHLIWDSATHGSGLLADLVPALRMRLVVIGGYQVFLCRLFQHGSTLLGSAAILYCVYRWYQVTPSWSEKAPLKSLPAVWLSRFTLLVIPLLVGAFSAAREFAAGAWLEGLRARVGHFIFPLGTTLIVVWVLLGLVYRAVPCAGAGMRIGPGNRPQSRPANCKPLA